MATTAWKLPQSAALSNGWSSPANITAKDDVAAHSGRGAGDSSGYLIASNFGFSDSDIPVGATIDGIEVRVKLKKFGPVWATTHLVLRKVNGVNVGSNKAASITITTNNLYSEPVAGAANDLWSTTWTDAEIKATSFQAAFQAVNTDGKYSSNLYVDSIECRVTYTAASPPTVTNNSAGNAYGTGGTVQMSATNTPTSWSLTSPPTGVSINSSGLVTWTSSTPAATHSITVTATNASGSGNGTLTLTITGLTPTVSSISPSSGTTAGGTAVTISGTNFVSDAVVAFGGDSGTSVVVVNSTTITCVTPARSSGACDVNVAQHSASLASSLINGFTYISPSPPTVLNPTSINGTIGSLFMTTVSGSNTPTSYSAFGLPLDVNINTSTGLISGIVPFGIKKFNCILYATNANGTGSKEVQLNFIKPSANSGHITKAKTSEPYKQGAKVTFLGLNFTKTSGIQSVDNANLSNRFDNTKYYGV